VGVCAEAQAQLKPLPQRRATAKRAPTSRINVLNAPEYLSGEASISVAASSNPLLRIGMAQNGVTLIEFPASDKFFAVHAGNSDLVTVEKSPTLKRDHHLVLRAGSGFLLPNKPARGLQAIAPATTIIAQMDSGIAITFLIYPVALLKQQAHRVVISYNTEEVVHTRRSVGLATNLTGIQPNPELPAVAAKPVIKPEPEPIQIKPMEPANVQPPPPDYREPAEAALRDAFKNPKWFRHWTTERHGLRICVLPTRDLNDTTRLVVFAVRNVGPETLRIISGYPDLYIETLNEQGRAVEAGTRVPRLHLSSSSTGGAIPARTTRYFALVYEVPSRCSATPKARSRAHECCRRTSYRRFNRRSEVRSQANEANRKHSGRSGIGDARSCG
jgi:hypothetical protein